MYKTSSYAFRLWGTMNFRGFQKHILYKIVLGIISHREKIDRQLAEQSSSIPFLSVKDIYNKRVIFDTWDRLEDKIDKLTAMMGKLVARDSEVNRPFKPQIYQSKRRGQGKNFYNCLCIILILFSIM